MGRRAARKAEEPEQVEEVQAKDFARAVKLYMHDIKPAISKAGEHNQEASTAYKAIKKHCGIQPAAAKLAFRLDEMEEAKRDDFLRCFTGLLAELNIPLQSADLVDMAEGKQVPQSRPKLVTVPDSDGIDADLADEGFEASEAEIAKQTERGKPRPGSKAPVAAAIAGPQGTA